MLNYKYEEQFRDYLCRRIGSMQKDADTPWIRATEEPILNGQLESYDGINLLLLTDHCRTEGLGERVFCTYEQRTDFDKPVWRNEKGFYIKLETGQGVHVFPCSRTDRMSSDSFTTENARHREMCMKYREHAGVRAEENINPSEISNHRIGEIRKVNKSQDGHIISFILNNEVGESFAVPFENTYRIY